MYRPPGGGLRRPPRAVQPRCRSASLPRSLGARSFAAWVGGKAGWVACLSTRNHAGLPRFAP